MTMLDASNKRGDIYQKYSNQVNNKSINKNLMLHSYEVKFMINDKKFTYRASLPKYFKKMLMTKRLSFLNESRLLNVDKMNMLMPGCIKFQDIREGIRDSLF